MWRLRRASWVGLALFGGPCCLGPAVAANRYMIQTRFDRRNGSCDECLMICGACVAFSNGASSGDDSLSSSFVETVLSCMLTQQEIELRHIEDAGLVYNGPSQEVYVLLPKSSQKLIDMSRAPKQQIMMDGGSRSPEVVIIRQPDKPSQHTIPSVEA